MTAPRPQRSTRLESRAFVVLLIAVTIGFGWILVPFFGAVFWGVVMAILFAPVHRRLVPKLRGRRTLAALVTLALILVIVIIPTVMITGALVREAAAVYARTQSGELNFPLYVAQVYDALPGWLTSLLDRAGLGNLAELQAKLTASLQQIGQFVGTQALAIGQNTLDLVVALVQGALGGLAFWVLGVNAALLWAVLMALLSLLPAVGAGLVWGPVAIWLFATGEVWPAVGLTLYGVFVIGLVDNVLRPLLVGKDTGMPDYLVLISTIGGIAVMGINGFVIGPVIAAMFVAVWDIQTATRVRARAAALAIDTPPPAAAPIDTGSEPR